MSKKKEQCEMCRKFPPCEKNKCCKRCGIMECNSRQCENRVVALHKKYNSLPWYLKDKIRNNE